MASIEQQMALEIFKPSTSFLNALLAPKVEKIRRWAEGRELQGQLEPSALSEAMAEYLNKLSRRVAEITTIAFPLQRLNISEAYEPLYLSTVNNSIEEYPTQFEAFSNKNKIDVPDLLSMNNSSFIIIDSAGMGKSTFSKHLVTQILFKTEKIPLFFELRKTDYEAGLIESIARELDSIGRSFPRELFYELINLGKFIIILDGFDEINIDNQVDLSSQIYDLSRKGGENILFLTSRPQEALPELIGSRTFQFSDFTKKQAISLVSRYDKIAGLDIGSRLTEQLESVPSRFIETPLLVSLLYRTFGTNNSIADRVCTFYDEIYHALYKGHDLINKNGYVREKKSKLDFEDFRRLLRALCYYMAITRKTSFDNWGVFISYIKKASEMSSIKPASNQDFLDDLMVAVPLVQRDGLEYKFLHKTIMEFFAAEYLIYKNNSLEVVDKIFHGKLFPSFTKIFDFIHDISPTLFDNVVTKYHAQSLVSINKINKYSYQLLSTLLYKNDVKAGLWLVDESIDDNPEMQNAFIDSIHNSLDIQGFFSSVSEELIIDGKNYRFAMAIRGSFITLHELAWEQISDENTLRYQKSRITSDDRSLIELLAVDTFSTLTFDMLEKLSECHRVIHHAENFLGESRFYHESQNHIRVFSPEKAKAILDRLERETAMDDEFNDLLS
ncbi:NACHT domain-containing protein [Aeromonas caviae]|uniref:NACHT domain-containing protein n=1 Tax=Aeromonas caviae TaxID=648 RepID=UPI00264A18EC|nr:NACHT domain-containing protein [Aeromonas caviae]MDN6870375.1 NACHT domain-containing protein [Aeromonas caviae]